jgi:hypothetical protein
MAPESIEQLTEWYESMLLEHHLQRHNYPEDEHCLPLHQAFVLGHDIKDHRALIPFNVSSAHFALNALRGIETGWGNQMNGEATFCFCSTNVDRICLRFNSMGLVNNPACWSYIPHQVKGQLTYTVTFYELQKAVISLLKANTAKDCPFSSCFKDLIWRPNVQRYICGFYYSVKKKLEIQTAQCDQLARWAFVLSRSIRI